MEYGKSHGALFPREKVESWPVFGKQDYPHYTTDPAAAMAVLERCAEKEAKEFDGVQIDKLESGWIVSTCEVDAHAPTLPLAITLFAKKLFEK